MAQVAYNLEHFAPQKRRQPKMRLAEKRQGSARKLQMLKMTRTLLGVAVLVGLICAVLYTQAKVTELQTSIAQAKQELVEEEALYAYLSFELDNKTSVKSIEENAAAMGLARMNGGQVTYFRVDEDAGIQVKQNPFARFFEGAKNGFMSILEYLSPDAAALPDDSGA